jgi:hypothetical protein
MKIIFTTFTDEKMKKSRNRICKQAKAMNVYDEIIGYGKKDLSIEFSNNYQQVLNSNIRGYGFWIWKPQIIKQKMMEMEYGDILHYVDAGCHFNESGKQRLREYFKIAEDSESGVVVFSPKDHPSEIIEGAACINWPIYKYTKGDMLDFFNARENHRLNQSQIICGTTFLIKKTKISIEIINRWSEITRNLKLMDDTRSSGGEIDGFIKHMCDQSAFSLLLKDYSVDVISNYEIEYPDLINKNKLNLKKMKNYPIHAKRDRGISLINRAIRKINSFLDKKNSS